MPADDEGRPQPAPRPGRPVWWWFVIHGVTAAAFGVFVLATPFTDRPGFLLDGHAFAVLAFVDGLQTTFYTLLTRKRFAGRTLFLVIGLHSTAAGIVLWTLASLGLATSLFWSIVSFLVVTALLLILGLLKAPLLRVWGSLMGGCMVVGVFILTVAWLADPEHSYDIPDAGLGVAALLYGVAVFVAALQSRATELRGGSGAQAK